ncbi:F0F1 ATP synthase subunit epsilon [Maridesulfovibrio hydrothermalis]|uniref:ATP synthase epsilon chain n=1 Tax=Maridesulfovibrio hydrothermalis AM13 = DSM 14728 TaxID=1121451 RepID=L0RAX5_9BACT|nr:F0F1 ATP synthase subunit epsilon [Maridesulfovibrio hydrothermalis]CCO23345.1 ATP synthase (subunit epsilon, F1 subunit) [Maridesulfovibrio hydrothermalis AM13 = DSM 14728]
MASKLLLEIVTPDRKVLSQEVDYVGAPGIEGEFGIMANHIPFLSALGVGNLYFKEGNRTHYIFISGGFAEVGNNKVTILAEVAEKAVEIDIARAQKAQEKAKARLAKAQDNIESARAQAALQRALSRLSCKDAAQHAGTTTH